MLEQLKSDIFNLGVLIPKVMRVEFCIFISFSINIILSKPYDVIHVFILNGIFKSVKYFWLAFSRACLRTKTLKNTTNIFSCVKMCKQYLNLNLIYASLNILYARPRSHNS